MAQNIQYLAKRELDLGKKSILEHTKFKLDLITNEVQDMFTYNTPLKEGAVQTYLLSSLLTSRHRWKTHFIATRKRHAGCPEEASSHIGPASKANMRVLQCSIGCFFKMPGGVARPYRGQTSTTTFLWTSMRRMLTFP